MTASQLPCSSPGCFGIQSGLLHALTCCHLSVFPGSLCICSARHPCVFVFSQVQIAACDTFRSGAVEQLRTHCNRLNIPLYERGYEKDPAKVAYEAIKSAERSNIDVLLVDTAGEILGQLTQLLLVTLKCMPPSVCTALSLLLCPYCSILTAEIVHLKAGIGICRAHARQ